MWVYMEGVRLTPIRRAPSKHRKIEDIDQKDIRISLIGAVVSKKDFEFVLDDGTGQINVICEEDTEFKEGDLVRVVGRLFTDIVQAEIVRKIDGMDMELYNKTYRLIKEYF